MLELQILSQMEIVQQDITVLLAQIQLQKQQPQQVHSLAREQESRPSAIQELSKHQLAKAHVHLALQETIVLVLEMTPKLCVQLALTVQHLQMSQLLVQSEHSVHLQD